jgi:hypothetical protein
VSRPHGKRNPLEAAGRGKNRHQADGKFCHVAGQFGERTLFRAPGIKIFRRRQTRQRPGEPIWPAASAIWSGENPYAIPDWHGWHYQYPPALAILFLPLAEPVPMPISDVPPVESRTPVNTPWGYSIKGHYYYGLHAANAHFFFSVAVWYALSVLGILLSAHALACALEGSRLRSPPPEDDLARRRWWRRRWWPLAVCAGSLLTDLSRGQADILMLVMISVGLYFVAAGERLKAGLCLAVPATVKLFPPLLLAYPLLRRQWRMAAGVAAGLVILLAVLPAATLGPKRTAELYQCWIEVLAKPALGEGTDTSRLRELTGMGSTDNQSLLAAIHAWTYRSLPRNDRPMEAAPWERYAVYAVGALITIAALRVIGFRRTDSPQELLVIAGLLIGIALIVSPIVASSDSRNSCRPTAAARCLSATTRRFCHQRRAADGRGHRHVFARHPQGTPAHPRPHQPDFQGFGISVERVIITDLKNSTYFARLILQQQNELARKIVELDARPSDCLALAAAQKKPISFPPAVRTGRGHERSAQPDQRDRRRSRRIKWPPPNPIRWR